MRRGITLLIALTITSSALLIALGIFQIIFGQIQLSQNARESHRALYSADIGKECALYYLRHKDNINAPGRSYWGPASSDMCFYKTGGGEDRSFCKDKAEGVVGTKCHNISCGGLPDITITVRDDANTCVATQEQLFQFTIDNPGEGICADVDIRTQQLSDGTTDYYKTIITSDGWNTCNISALNRVNRTLQYVDCADISSQAYPCI